MGTLSFALIAKETARGAGPAAGVGTSESESARALAPAQLGSGPPSGTMQSAYAC